MRWRDGWGGGHGREERVVDVGRKPSWKVMNWSYFEQAEWFSTVAPAGLAELGRVAHIRHESRKVVGIELP